MRKKVYNKKVKVHTKEKADLKRKLLIAFMIVFTILLAVNLFISLICGAPIGSEEQGRYFIGAVIISILLPSGFTFFFLSTLRLSERLQEKESETAADEEYVTDPATDIPANIRIPALVNALAEKENLTAEERERLLSFLKDI